MLVRRARLIEEDSAIAELLGAAIRGAADDLLAAAAARVAQRCAGRLLLWSDPARRSRSRDERDALASKGAAQPLPAVSFTGQRSLFRFVKSGGALLAIWSAPFIGPVFHRRRRGAFAAFASAVAWPTGT